MNANTSKVQANLNAESAGKRGIPRIPMLNMLRLVGPVDGAGSRNLGGNSQENSNLSRTPRDLTIWSAVNFVEWEGVAEKVWHHCLLFVVAVAVAEDVVCHLLFVAVAVAEDVVVELETLEAFQVVVEVVVVELEVDVEVQGPRVAKEVEVNRRENEDLVVARGCSTKDVVERSTRTSRHISLTDDPLICFIFVNLLLLLPSSTLDSTISS